MAQNYLYNETDSAIRVADGTGVNRRFPPGQPVPVSGDLESNAQGVDGLRPATKEEVEASTSGFSSESRDISRDKALADMAAYSRMATVAVPLNEVVGDDEAPYGPPSGTITTKQAVMREAGGSGVRQHFGEGEWLPEDAEERDLSAVQEQQAIQSGRVEKLTEQIQNLKEGDSIEVSPTEVKGAAGLPSGGPKDPIRQERKAKASKSEQK